MEQLKDKYFDGSSLTKYAHVYFQNNTKEFHYINLKYAAKIQIGNKRYCKCFRDIKQAALQIDKWLIQAGKEPVNILKRVKQ